MKQRLDFPFQEKIETMDRWAIMKGKKSLKQRFDFPVEENIKSMDSMAIIEEQKIIEIMVTLSISKKRLKLWLD